MTPEQRAIAIDNGCTHLEMGACRHCIAAALEPSEAVKEFIAAHDEHWRYMIGKKTYTFSLERLEKARAAVRQELGL